MSAAADVKERPILFSGPMVRAILDGRKTQTRRIVKGVPDSPIKSAKADFDVNGRDFGVWFHCGDGQPVSKHNYSQFNSCPYGKPGDRLWVRETWACRDDVDPQTERDKALHYMLYRASYSGNLGDEWHGYDQWRPSIHMPRWASRITLEIVSVRVERLQAISRDDAIAEGTSLSMRDPGSSGQWLWEPVIGKVACPSGTASGPVECFKIAWEAINGAGSWDANPWVWAIEFRRLEQS